MVLSSRPAHHDARVIGGRRHHGEHLARLWFYGHDTAYLAFEQTLTKGLKVEVDAERQVLACHRLTVILAILVIALYAAARIAQQDLHTFLAAKLFLIIFLYAELANVVAWLIIVVVLDVAHRHLSHIAQHMGGIRILVLADAASLNIKAGKTEYFFLEHRKLLTAELAHEQLLREARVAGVL